jgi:hypothetical protein
MPTLYEKRGRRYVPVADDRVWDHWPQGFHIVYVPYDGGQSTRFSINPDKAAFVAGIMQKEDALRREIDACFRFRPASRELTPAQAKAWKAFEKATDNHYCIERESVMGVIDRIMRVLEC